MVSLPNLDKHGSWWMDSIDLSRMDSIDLSNSWKLLGKHDSYIIVIFKHHCIKNYKEPALGMGTQENITWMLPF